MAKLDRAQVLGYRYHVNGLKNRLPSTQLVTAARPGLQDTAPHAGVLSLHARVAGVVGDDWSDRRLTQVWGPRGAIYLVPKDDLGVFTHGRLPRDDSRLQQLQRQARQVLRVLDGRPQRPETVAAAIGEIGDLAELAWTAATGWFLPIWDAASTALYPAEPAESDPEEDRRELARRFLHYLGPATTKGFQWWAGVDASDATATIQALAPELTTVDVDGEEALLLAADVETARTAAAMEGLQLLPPGDVYINRLCGPVLTRKPQLRSRLHPAAALPGAIVVNGEVTATWTRRGRRFTIEAWPAAPVDDLVGPVLAAARSLPLAGDPDDTVVDWAGD